MCNVELESKDSPGHTHVCAVDGPHGAHMCSDRSCRRWFGKKEA